MELNEAHQIYLSIKDSKLTSLSDRFFKAAVRYARLRVDWFMGDGESRIEMDAERRYAHNAFISCCDILARNMNEAGEDASWRLKIGRDRKSIGDFACQLHAVFGIIAR